jgi:hypothetical protein
VAFNVKNDFAARFRGLWRPTFVASKVGKTARAGEGARRVAPGSLRCSWAPLGRPARSAFRSERPQIVWRDARDSSRRYGRGSQRARCGLAVETLRDGPLRGLRRVWTRSFGLSQTTLAQATPEPPARARRARAGRPRDALVRDAPNSLWSLTLAPLRHAARLDPHAPALLGAFEAGRAEVSVFSVQQQHIGAEGRATEPITASPGSSEHPVPKGSDAGTREPLNKSTRARRRLCGRLRPVGHAAHSAMLRARVPV